MKSLYSANNPNSNITAKKENEDAYAYNLRVNKFYSLYHLYNIY